jgi:hypothetical protein
MNYSPSITVQWSEMELMGKNDRLIFQTNENES